MTGYGQLIDELDSAGVRHTPLGELGEFIRGRRFTKSDYVEYGLGSIHYGEIYTDYGTTAAIVNRFVRPELKPSLRLARHGDLIIAATGENVRDVCKAVAWLGEEEVAVHDDCFVFRHALDPTFMAYFFQSSHFHNQKMQLASESKLARVSQANLAKIVAPIPPLELQHEIVRILNTFAELEARRRQYEYYRLERIHRCDAPRATLAELGQWHGGITPSKSNQRFWDGGTIPWLASMDVSSSQGREIRGKVTQAALDETTLKVIPGPSVAVVMRSNILRRSLPVGLIRPDVTVNQDIRILAPHIGVDAEYVYQTLQAAREDIRTTCVRTDGSMAAVNSKAFLKFAIPLPELSKQRQVAADLRHFDVIVTDLNAGLPAELAARRRQYEHYRDRLLTFEEAPS